MVQCHNFQRRLCWQLTSLLAQELPEGVDLSVSVAAMRGNGDPTTEEVVEFFMDKGLDVRLCPYDDIETFQRRGLTRNRQLAETSAEWAFLADSDMIYPPDFVDRMFKYLWKREEKGKSLLRVFHGRRWSTELEPTVELVDDSAVLSGVDIVPYPRVVDGYWEMAEALPSKRRPDRCAGYMHLIHVPSLKEYNGGLYQPEGVVLDRSWRKGQKARSDLWLKKRIGKAKVRGLPKQIHLQHPRDNEAGRHLEDQR